MFIKRLSMYGFKTFADETSIDFNKGVTVVLGPNGSGKSNIVEAFMWILGEQSATSLRVHREEGLEGLIFRGTDEKKRMGFAMVSLTLDNESRWLPYETPEVTVKREYFRSGESNVYINDEPVRLKDLTELFLGTGLGRNAYSVIKQGTVDKIVEQNPIERRQIIEEAAGISKYIERRKDALRKLEESEANLDKTRTTLREVEKQYRQLKEQAERTERFYRMNDEKKKAMIDLNLHLVFKARAAETSLAADMVELNTRRETLEKEFTEFGDRKKSEVERYDQLKADTARIDKQRFEVFNEMTHIQRDVNSLNGQKANTVSDLDESRKRHEKLQEKFNACNDEMRAFENERVVIKDTMSTLGAEQEREQARIDEERRRIDTNRQRLTEIAAEMEVLRAKVQDARIKQKELIDKIIAEIDVKKKDIEHLSVYQNKDKIEHDIEIGFTNILSSLEGKASRIGEFEEIGVLTTFSDVNYQRLVEFVAKLKERLEVERRDTKFLRQIFEEYIKIKDPFVELLFDKEGTYRRKETIDQEIAVAEFDINRLEKETEAARAAIVAAQETIERANGRIAEIAVTSAQMMERHGNVESGYERVMKERAEVEQEIAAWAARIEKLDMTLKNLENEHTTGNQRLLELKEKHSALDKEFKERTKELKAAEGNISSYETGITQRVRKLDEIRENLARINERLIDIHAKIDGIYTSFYENHATDLKEFEKQALEKAIDEDKIREKIEKLKNQIRDLGAINEMALDEFAEAKERFEFLTRQKEDLEKARVEILNVIDESNREATILFKKTFEEVDKNFREIFDYLFPGSRAGLTLTDENNLLETGIDIFVQQKGSKRENIVSNSGGERSMIGLSLVFAIFRYHPSPFCILDEADAALDAANVVRFKEIVKQFSEKTQFLVITHNEITATIADTFYGVTRPEKGPSNIYTLRVNDDGSVNESGNVHILA
ncbi:MAG: AAA family ATPase [Spirochaetes bacterium]|nr:AAA family ATPase [Spirochaetota bacterium]